MSAAIPAASAEEDAIPSGEHVVRAAVVPNDPLYRDDLADDFSQWGPKKIGMEDAWSDTTGGGRTIAIVDSGVRADGTYPDLNGRVLPGWDFVDDDANANDEMDTEMFIGHGTFVAMIAAAKGNDGQGMAGYCWQCKVLPVRVLDENGFGNTGWVAEGIEWAVDHGADIINLSLNGPSSSPSLDQAIASAQTAGVLVIAAAGNEDPNPPAEDLTVPQYPAAVNGVTSVAASDEGDALYSWSYRGSSWVKVAAPGCIFEMDTACGTSFASPAVAGLLSLGWTVAPCATAGTLLNALYSTTDPANGGGVEYGRVSAPRFLDSVRDAEPAIRLAGTSRIATAVAVSRRAYDSAPAVVLARADSYADALAAAPLAAKVQGPVLLTAQNELPEIVREEIERLGANDVWLAGGKSAIGSGVVSDLKAMGFTSSDLHRRFGENRYATAGAIGVEVGGQEVFIVSGSSFADGVAVSTLAAKKQAPVLLVAKDALPPDTLNALSQLAPTSVHLIGGPGVVSDEVAQEIEDATSVPVDRVFGASRYETSKALGEMAATAGLDPKRILVATGKNWPDALAAGPAAAAAGGILLLADSSATMVRAWIEEKSVSSIDVIGGPATISDGLICTMEMQL
jgi:putative cell wall-binding protein